MNLIEKFLRFSGTNAFAALNANNERGRMVSASSDRAKRHFNTALRQRLGQ